MSTPIDEIRDWPPVVGVPMAGGALGISRSYSFELARRGDFPAKVIKVGSRYRVVTASILALLEVEPARESA
ncbi:MAG: hypothetical protein JWQ81_6058 [Amycolatopsis sp.]|uniref:DNA-binding protein n=1 Tax=Amycolatopsis sp. TaxID=37632 RepID=UPI0026160A65|nr:DNA-binding protein [Amycolatopsis sp.]MCU1685319.1 hypothetical protein [Amycolatopsis sp.]